MSDPDVKGITPINWAFLRWRNPEDRSTRQLLAIGFEPNDPLFIDSDMKQKAQLLTQRNRVLFDELSREEFGPIGKWFREGRTVETELTGKRVRVVGLVSIGPSFGADGNLITSTETLRSFLPDPPEGSIEIGLVRLNEQADAASVKDRLSKRLPEDVRVYTKGEFEEIEKNYWRTSTAIGFIFTLGAAMGFVVGCVIVYQILYSDVSDHLPEYATLMAMGYPLTTLLAVVAREGLLLAIMGYIPAFAAGSGLYRITQSATKLPVIMDGPKALLVFVLILVICMGSALLAMRKLAEADPAEIF